jgi:hypothetical protein
LEELVKIRKFLNVNWKKDIGKRYLKIKIFKIHDIINGVWD